VRLVIADTGPVNYLVLIGHIEILPALFERVTLPLAVKDELADQDTPAVIRNWIATLPEWIEIRLARALLTDAAIAELGAGETEAITLATELKADLLLMDDRRGVTVAVGRGLNVTGTMGLLARAANHGILNLAEAFEKLKRTNFRYRQETMDLLLEESQGKS